MIWICSDWHFSHDKEFVWKVRGFNSVAEMNAEIVKRHNSMVAEDDDVYVLGDLCMGNDLEANKVLLESVNGENKERDYCILTLFLNCGLRLAELCGLNVNDVNFENETMIVTGKGSKQRVVYLNDACISALKKYLYILPQSLGDGQQMEIFASLSHWRIGGRLNEIVKSNHIDRSSKR